MFFWSLHAPPPQPGGAISVIPILRIRALAELLLLMLLVFSKMAYVFLQSPLTRTHCFLSACSSLCLLLQVEGQACENFYSPFRTQLLAKTFRYLRLLSSIASYSCSPLPPAPSLLPSISFLLPSSSAHPPRGSQDFRLCSWLVIKLGSGVRGRGKVTPTSFFWSPA